MTKPASNPAYLGLLGVLLFFIIGYVHHQWFYPLFFNGDSAAMHVLAKSIVDEISLLPHDFSYGNQLVFLRSSPFIALAMACGLDGYPAFSVGSALSISFWGAILHYLLSVHFKSPRRGLLLTVLLLIPLGGWETEYILGQQSHLSNAILALGILIGIGGGIQRNSPAFLAIGCVCLFLMSSEAPIRGLLILAPTMLATALTTGFRPTVRITVLSSIAFIMGYTANKLLLQTRPIAMDYFSLLTFKSSEALIDNLLKTSLETFSAVSNMDIMAGSQLSISGLFLFGLSLLLVLGYVAFIFHYSRSGIRHLARLKPAFVHAGEPTTRTHLDFIPLAATAGVIVGAIAVSAINPDSSRHYLWAIFTIKFCLCALALDLAIRWLRPMHATLALLALGLLMSTWTALLTTSDWNTSRHAQAGNYPEPIQTIRRILETEGIQNVYGEDFWRMMPLNSLIPGANAQALLPGGYRPHLYAWLSRPSWACPEGQVLYYLRDGQADSEARTRLVEIGGNQVHEAPGYSLWIGPPVWHLPPGTTCPTRQLIFDEDTITGLPHTTGDNVAAGRSTNGEPGFLAYGPYSALAADRYQLTVYGRAESLQDAYVDIVSEQGARVHARFPLSAGPDKSVLQQGTFRLASDTADLEVRVWVNDNDRLTLHGYRLDSVDSVP